MARFDVYRVGRSHLVVDVQADLLDDLRTRVVLPLGPLGENAGRRPERLRPEVAVAGQAYEIATDKIATLDVARLGEKVGNLEAHHHDITAAIDFLLQGF